MPSLKIPISVLVVIYKSNRDVLLIERADRSGFWQSVTGSLDVLDEDLAFAAAREVFEETGIAVDQLPKDALQNMHHRGELKHRLRPGEKNEVIRKCSEHVSSKLNNTPSVSKQSYIDDKILDLVMRNPYRLAGMIPTTDEGRHRFLYKILTRVRNTH